MSYATFYTVVGFNPDPFAPVADGGHGYAARPRTYSTIGPARNMITRLRKRARPGTDYDILVTTVYDDGAVSSGWLDG